MIYERTLADNNYIRYERSAQQYQRSIAHSCTLKMVFNGQQDFMFGHNNLSIFPDCLIFIAPGTSYQCWIDSDEPVESLSIYFDDQFFSDFFSEMHKENQEKSGENDWHHWFSIGPMSADLRYNFKHLLNKLIDSRTAEGLLKLYLEHCLINYRRSYVDNFLLKRKNLPFVKSDTKIEISRKLSLAKAFISTNYNQKFSMPEVASACCLSENHLFRTFRQMYGMSPFQYLTLVRLSRAKNYLAQGRYSVNQVVMLVGFESVSTFVQLFKETFKITPARFKRQLLHKAKFYGM